MYTRKEIATARKIAKSYGVHSLFSCFTANPKTEKNSKLLGIATIPLHLAPGDLGGYQVCPMASAGCLAACLHTAGNPVYMGAKEKARLARKKLYFENREIFMILLYAEVAAHVKRAARKGMFCGVRLNATSDIAYETVKFANGQNIFQVFPDVLFYDYTAIPKRIEKMLNGTLPGNYHLTFSAKENNEEKALELLARGATVAMVFDTKRGKALPESYKGFPVIDADVHDFRPNDPQGHIAGLRAKGDAIGDESGFVRSSAMTSSNVVPLDAMRAVLRQAA